MTTCMWEWSNICACALDNIPFPWPSRQAMIAENMQKMPQMIEDYRKRVYEIRETNRKKKERSEQEEYLLATGQKQQRPAWQEFKDKRKPKR